MAAGDDLVPHERMCEDLQSFEVAIRATYTKLTSVRRFYCGLLLLLVVFAIYCLGCVVFTDRVEVTVLSLAINMTTLLGVAAAAILLFFLTGLYTCKIKAPANYIMWCNSGLRSFHLRYDVSQGRLVVAGARRS
eukprot:TRINITY_DN13248_c0_g1_i1.p1 TRINITY_DN13248_c0_g1~~TRINITY_DN13248_c0_g1_i1.p1  ORF type:complete len:134 (+),score=32.62 TRINITY_DN13248_c0_g1_i1:58-459(+)